MKQLRYKCPRCGAITKTNGRLGNLNNLKCMFNGCRRSLSRRHQLE